MNLKKGGVGFALVALALFSEGLLAQQMPGTGSELRFDSSGNQQQSPSQMPIQSPTIVTPQGTPGADKVISNSTSPSDPRCRDATSSGACWRLRRSPRWSS